VLVGGVPTATYSEGVFGGYRHYDESNVTPLFPFGFGLSYTTFSFSNLSISPSTFTFTGNPNQTVTVSCNVINTGSVAGAEVAEVYVGIPSTAVPEPPKWLKGFQKITLAPGQTGQVQVTLNLRSFAYWDITGESWKVVPGTYQIMVGDSSRNIELQSTVAIN
jgi:beta-glucosidase